MYEIYTQTHISAAHHLREYDGECKKLHGHNWIIKTFIRCDELDELEMGLDFKVLKKAVKQICENLDHADLNEVPYFKEHNPTSESMAKYLFDEIGKKINNDRVRVSRVEVQETPGNGAIYWG